MNKKLVLVIILISAVSLLFAYGGRVLTESTSRTIELGTNLVDTSAAVSDSFLVTVGEKYVFDIGLSDSVVYWNAGAKGATISTTSTEFTTATYDSIIVYGDCSTAKVRAKVEDWTAVDTLMDARYDSWAYLIYTDPTDSIVAYRIKGFVDAASTEYYLVEDSAQATGTTGEFIEWDPSNFSKVILEFYEISDSLDYTIDRSQKNPYE